MINPGHVRYPTLSKDTVAKVNKLHKLRDDIRLKIWDGDERLVEDLKILNFTLQALWGFPRDVDNHAEAFY